MSLPIPSGGGFPPNSSQPSSQMGLQELIDDYSSRHESFYDIRQQGFQVFAGGEITPELIQAIGAEGEDVTQENFGFYFNRFLSEFQDYGESVLPQFAQAIQSEGIQLQQDGKLYSFGDEGVNALIYGDLLEDGSLTGDAWNRLNNDNSSGPGYESIFGSADPIEQIANAALPIVASAALGPAIASQLPTGAIGAAGTSSILDAGLQLALTGDLDLGQVLESGLTAGAVSVGTDVIRDAVNPTVPETIVNSSGETVLNPLYQSTDLGQLIGPNGLLGGDYLDVSWLSDILVPELEEVARLPSGQLVPPDPITGLFDIGGQMVEGGDILNGLIDGVDLVRPDFTSALDLIPEGVFDGIADVGDFAVDLMQGVGALPQDENFWFDQRFYDMVTPRSPNAAIQGAFEEPPTGHGGTLPEAIAELFQDEEPTIIPGPVTPSTTTPTTPAPEASESISGPGGSYDILNFLDEDEVEDDGYQTSGQLIIDAPYVPVVRDPNAPPIEDLFSDPIPDFEEIPQESVLPREQAVIDLYMDVLGRLPDPGGLEFWTGDGWRDNPEELRSAFMAAAEAEMLPEETVMLPEDGLWRVGPDFDPIEPVRPGDRGARPVMPAPEQVVLPEEPVIPVADDPFLEGLPPPEIPFPEITEEPEDPILPEDSLDLFPDPGVPEDTLPTEPPNLVLPVINTPVDGGTNEPEPFLLPDPEPEPIPFLEPRPDYGDFTMRPDYPFMPMPSQPSQVGYDPNAQYAPWATGYDVRPRVPYLSNTQQAAAFRGLLEEEDFLSLLQV